jgi:hypothetical protein
VSSGKLGQQSHSRHAIGLNWRDRASSSARSMKNPRIAIFLKIDHFVTAITSAEAIVSYD